MKYFLGSLESAIMEVLWGRGPATVREVVDILRQQRRLAYTTVMTVMTRLAADGYLKRTSGPNNSYQYHPAETREDFAARCTRGNIDALIAEYGDVALVQFLSKIDRISPEKLQRLKRLVSRKRHE